MDIILAVIALIAFVIVLACVAVTLAFIADVVHERYFMSPSRQAYEKREREFAIWAELKTRRLERERKERS